MSAGRIALLLLAGSILAGCGGKVPATHYYVLEPGDLHRERQTSEGSGAAIGVRAFRVDPPYDQDRIVYRIGVDSSEVGFYAYHRWAAPLSRMLPAMTADLLAAVPGVAIIEPMTAEGRYDVWLDGRLRALEETDTTEGQQVHLRLELTLRDSIGGVIWTETIERRIDGASETVEDVVDRMQRGLREALGSVQPSLGRALEGRPDPAVAGN